MACAIIVVTPSSNAWPMQPHNSLPIAKSEPKTNVQSPPSQQNQRHIPRSAVVGVNAIEFDVEQDTSPARTAGLNQPGKSTQRGRIKPRCERSDLRPTGFGHPLVDVESRCAKLKEQCNREGITIALISLHAFTCHRTNAGYSSGQYRRRSQGANRMRLSHSSIQCASHVASANSASMTSRPTVTSSRSRA